MRAPAVSRWRSAEPRSAQLRSVGPSGFHAPHRTRPPLLSDSCQREQEGKRREGKRRESKRRVGGGLWKGAAPRVTALVSPRGGQPRSRWVRPCGFDCRKTLSSPHRVHEFITTNLNTPRDQIPGNRIDLFRSESTFCRRLAVCRGVAAECAAVEPGKCGTLERRRAGTRRLPGLQ